MNSKTEGETGEVDRQSYILDILFFNPVNRKHRMSLSHQGKTKVIATTRNI